MEQTYRDAGLRTISVHTPEFPFERSGRQVARAVRELELSHPVLRDDAMSTATAYRSSYLPAKYLVDARGMVRAISYGEGGYDRVEQQIRTLLAERVGRGALPPAVGELEYGEVALPGTTRQINFGDSRGSRYDTESDTVVGDDTRFRLPNAQPDGTFSFGGTWRVGTQAAEPRRGAVARVSFRARRAYQLVGGSGTLTVTTSSGIERVVRVDGTPRLRQIYGLPTDDLQTLTVRYDGDLEVYAFSFG